MQNIKEFLESGEKEFDEKFTPARNGDYTEHPRPHILAWHNSRQISLIKMVVEMCESEKKYTEDTVNEDGGRYGYCNFCEDHISQHNEEEKLICGCDYHNSALDTISSKLKELTDGK